jgi:hypothetical protein
LKLRITSPAGSSPLDLGTLKRGNRIRFEPRQTGIEQARRSGLIAASQQQAR